MDNASLTAEDIVRRSMEIAGDMCVYTNHNLIVENIPQDEKDEEDKSDEKELANDEEEQSKDNDK